MSISFATKISTLRREKNITQKVAAEELGISQALLSHYEKGIRECNLSFVAKAALYYNVSSDYLLGLSENKHNSGDILENSFLPSDSQINSKTILRSILYLQNVAETENDLSEEFFNNYFSLAIKKYTTLIQKNNKGIGYLCDMATLNLPKSSEQNDLLKKQTPEFLKTVDSHSVALINKSIEKTLK